MSEAPLTDEQKRAFAADDSFCAQLSQALQTDFVPGVARLLARIALDMEEIKRLKDELQKEERDCEQVIGQRDRAQDALQETHITLGGDGEWVARLPNTPVPNSGDLHEDVPVLAAIVREMRDEAMEELSSLREKLTRAREALKSFDRLRNTDVVTGGGILTLTNGKRMVCIDADAFKKASEVHASLSTAEDN